MITALYASLLAIPLFILSIGVIGLRGNPVFVFIAQVKGDGELLQRVIRAHGSLHASSHARAERRLDTDVRPHILKVP